MNKCLCALGVVSLSHNQKENIRSVSDVTEGGSEVGHFELQCEYCLSRSPPAPPLSCQALSLSLSPFSTLIPLTPPLLHAHCSPTRPPTHFSSSSPKSFPPLSHSTHFSNETHSHTSISVKPISPYLSIRRSSLSSLFSILCFSPSLSSLYLFQSSHMWIWLLELMQHMQLKAEGWGVGACLL